MHATFLLLFVVAATAMSPVQQCLARRMRGGSSLLTKGAVLRAPMAVWIACATAAPVDDAVAQEVLAAVVLSLSFYTYTDVVLQQQGISLRAQIAALNATYRRRSAYHFHAAVAGVLWSAKDLHLHYGTPVEFEAFVYRPYLFTLRNTAGGGPSSTLHLTTQPAVGGPGVAEAMATGLDRFMSPTALTSLAEHNGTLVVGVNGMAAEEWVAMAAGAVTGVRDPVAAMNAVARGNFQLNAFRAEAIETREFDEIELTGGSVVTVPRIVSIRWDPDTRRVRTMAGAASHTAMRREALPETTFHAQQSSPSEGLLVNSPEFRCALRGTDTVHLQITTFSPDLGVPVTSVAYNDALRRVMPWLLEDLRVCLRRTRGKTLLLDLRSNPGGHLTFVNAVEMVITSQTLPGGASMRHVARWATVLDFRAGDLSQGYSRFVAAYLNNTGNVTSGTAMQGQGWWAAGPRSPKYFRLYSHRNASEYSTDPWGYERLVVLTDGLCASACSQMESRLVAHFGAVVVGVAGHGVMSDTSVSAGGLLYSYSAVAASRAVPAIVLSDADVWFGIEGWYINLTDALPREWLPRPPSFQILMWPPYDVDAMVDAIRSYVRKTTATSAALTTSTPWLLLWLDDNQKCKASLLWSCIALLGLTAVFI